MNRDKRAKSIDHAFVEFVPNEMKAGTVYVSIEYATAVHLCACGCGAKVVTPLTPTDWKLIFDGETISLDPSIGNWNFPCRSHYWINQNRVEWAGDWSEDEVDAGRTYDRRRKERFYAERKRGPAEAKEAREPPNQPSIFARLWRKKST